MELGGGGSGGGGGGRGGGAATDYRVGWLPVLAVTLEQQICGQPLE